MGQHSDVLLCALLPRVVVQSAKCNAVVAVGCLSDTQTVHAKVA